MKNDADPWFTPSSNTFITPPPPPPLIDIDAVPLVTVAATPAPVKLKNDAEPWFTPSSSTYIVLLPPPPPPFKANDAVKAYDALAAFYI